MSLQEADRRLLRLLQADAGLSLKDLAERAAMSSSTAWRRVQDLEAAGYITGRVALVDPGRIGLTVCMMISINITTQTHEARQTFENFARGRENIQQCLAITGAHDYVLIVRAANVADFERFLMDEVLALPVVASAQSQLVLRHCKNATALPV